MTKAPFGWARWKICRKLRATTGLQEEKWQPRELNGARSITVYKGNGSDCVDDSGPAKSCDSRDADRLGLGRAQRQRRDDVARPRRLQPRRSPDPLRHLLQMSRARLRGAQGGP